MWGRPSIMNGKFFINWNCVSGYFWGEYGKGSQDQQTHLEKPVCPPWWLWADGLSIMGLRSERFEPSELNDVVFELNPCHRPTSEFRFLSKFVTSPPLKPVAVVLPPPVLYCLYQSGIFNRCNEACTRSWCSLSAVFDSRAFCNSFSGGCK